MRQTKEQLIKSLDDFTRHYIIAALWSSHDYNDPIGEPLDRNYSIEDLTVTALLRCKADCEKFQSDNARALALANYREGYYADGHSYNKEELAGHDFWLTRNGHGTGFWDRGLRLCLGKILTNAAKEYSECHLYVQKGKVGIE